MPSMTGLVQESLIAMLLYDKEYGGRIRSLVPTKMFGAPYRRLAEKASTYWEAYNEPPGEHATDLCDELIGSDPRQAETVRRIFSSIQATKDGLNAKYVMTQVSAFMREQRLREGIIKAVGLMEEGRLDEAEAAVPAAMKASLDLFHPGLIFNKMRVSDAIFDDVEAIPTGIKELDDKNLGPTAGELHLLIAPSGFGKSWWLAHLAKHAIMHRKRVVYVTLEMSETKMAVRFLQSFFAVSKRRETLVSRMFVEDELGRFVGIKESKLKDKETLALSDKDIVKKLSEKHSNMLRRSPLVLRQFPTGSLTVHELVGYLDCLEAQQSIIPDLLLIDYPDLMHFDIRQDHRIAIGKVFQDLRGLAIKRNMAVAVVSQTNRQALGKRLITAKDVAEDYSKIATSDVAFSYNQTEEEMKQGLARIHVMKARNDEKGSTILLTQNYAIGQFCISSTRMVPNLYWQMVNKELESDSGDGRAPVKKKRRKQ